MKLKNFIFFLLLNFWPIVCGMGIFAPLFLLVVLIADKTKDRLFFLAMFLAVFLIPLGLVYLCYYLCTKSASWLKKGFIIYLFWLILGFMSAYLVSASLAGTSMAVAEGLTKGWNLFLQEIGFAGIILLFTQILIIPWVIISVIVMKRKESVFFRKP